MFIYVSILFYSIGPSVFLWDSQLYECVDLWVYICFLCLLLGSFPSVELFCSISMCLFLFYLIMFYSLQTFLTRDKKGVGLDGKGSGEELKGVEGG